MSRRWVIIKAGDGHIFRDTQFKMFRSRYRAVSHIVAAREDSGGPIRKFEKRTGASASAGRHEITLHYQLRIGSNPHLQQSITVALVTITRYLIAQRALNVGNTPVPQLQQ